MKSLYRRRTARTEDQIPLLPLSKDGSLSSSWSASSPPPSPSLSSLSRSSSCPSVSPSTSSKSRLTVMRAINHLRRNARGTFAAAAVLPLSPAYVALQMATFSC
ncbi:hypothetical protein E4U32_001197 [Claviceps aff. humidiphila group G2b]|nr:hypothetical protein E4U32_001197 [Claviceps aff. humidiphila group G2b]